MEVTAFRESVYNKLSYLWQQRAMECGQKNYRKLFLYNLNYLFNSQTICADGARKQFYRKQ